MDGAAGDYKKTFKYRAALAAVIILSILIVLALIALVVGSVMKFGNAPGKSQSAAPSGTAQPFSLPAGARILSSETQGGRLILRVRNGAAEDIYIVDTSDGHLISRIQAAAPE